MNALFLKRILFLCSFSFPLILFANQKIDNLKIALNHSTNKKDSIHILNQLAREFCRVNLSQSEIYANLAFELSTKVAFPSGRANSLASVSLVKLLSGNVQRALKIFSEVEILTQEYNLDSIQAEVYHFKGLAYQMLGDYKESLIHYHEALLINQRLGRKEHILRQFNNIAIVRRELKDYEIALEYLEKLVVLAQEIGNDNLLSFGKMNLGYVYLDQNKFDEALLIVEPTLQEYIEAKDSIGISIGKNILAQIYLGLNKLDLALVNANDAINLAKIVGYKDGIIDGLYTSGETSFRQKSYNLAISKALQALELIDTNKTTRYVDGILNTLVNCYKKNGNDRLALEYQNQLIKVKEKIFAKDRENLVYKLEVDNRIIEKEAENQALMREVDLNAKVIRQQRYLNFSLSCIGLLILGLCFVLYRHLQEKTVQKTKLEDAVAQRTTELKDKNEELRKANQELERFAYITSHDLKEPLRNIITFTQLLEGKLKGQDHLKEYTEFIVSGAKQLYCLIENILEFSRLRGNNPNDFETVDLNDILRKVSTSLTNSLKKNRVELICDNLPQVRGNPSLLYLAFKNIIENGIKFNEQKTPRIEISHQKKGELYEISCKDNGIGIPKDYQGSIFEMFKRLHNQSEYKGSGLGLAISKKVIKLHGGNIWVNSKESEGSTFSFTLHGD